LLGDVDFVTSSVEEPPDAITFGAIPVELPKVPTISVDVFLVVVIKLLSIVTRSALSTNFELK
jgi:hypothetical protein